MEARPILKGASAGQAWETGGMKSFEYIYRSVACLVVAGLLAIAAPAAAGYEKTSLKYDIDEPRKLGLTYDVYAGGFKALRAQLGLDLDVNAYDMELAAQTQGFIGDLFPWSATYSTSGHAEDGELIPTLYTSKSSWRKKVKFTEMR